MKALAMPLGILALFGTIIPPTLFLLDGMDESTMKATMLLSTIVWLATAPFWLKGTVD